jgi:hypothetical protein
MRERLMLVPNVIKPMHLALVQEHGHRKGMNRRVTPPLIKEAAAAIKEVKVIEIGLRTQKLDGANLEIAPEMTTIVGRAIVFGDKVP